MSALRAIHPPPPRDGQNSTTPPVDGRRSGGERRQADRRGNVYPLVDKDLRFAARAAGFGVFDLDCANGRIFLSSELGAMAGLPPGTAKLGLDEVERLVHPDDRQCFVDQLRTSLDPGHGEEGFEADFRLLRSDGTVRWVKARGRSFFVGEGEERRPLTATGIVMDVTAARDAELALRQSRAQLEGLVDTAIDGIISIDGGQRIILFNPAASRIFRCPPEEAIGSPLDRFIPARARVAHREHVRAFAESGATARDMGKPGVLSGLRDDGEEFPIEASISKVLVGGEWQMTVFVRDITERCRAEEALRRSREDFELALHGAAMGMWNWDMRTGEVLWSERCRELFGMREGEAESYERFLAALHPEDRGRTVAAVGKATEERQEFNIEYRVVWPDGSIHWINAVGRCFFDEAGGMPLRMRGVVLDITARKEWEETLVRMNEQLESRIGERTAALVQAKEALERSNLELQQFAYIAAHDLKTPLRSIIGFAQLFHGEYRGHLDAQADAWLEQLLRSAERMHELIQDLLAYSRVDSQGRSFRPIDMRQLFDEVTSALDSLIRESGATVSCGELPVVMGDRSQLAQVLQNLVDNGIKYHGSAPPEVRVTARRDGENWLFEVRDKGIGIAEKHRERIFEIFHRLHTQQEYPGTGIGLAVCRRVIHRHGGRIWVESEPDKGSVFCFTLPDKSRVSA